MPILEIKPHEVKNEKAKALAPSKSAKAAKHEDHKKKPKDKHEVLQGKKEIPTPIKHKADHSHSHKDKASPE